MLLETQVNIVNSLLMIVGGDKYAAKAWLDSFNKHLDATPIQLLKTEEGATQVLSYLESIRRV